MKKTVIDIGYGDLDLYVNGQLILQVGQVSDERTINLFLYPKGDLIKSIIKEEYPESNCSHEIIVEREKIK